ncbi:hypothetical protein RUND412_005103 [Rhizina undulata]
MEDLNNLLKPHSLHSSKSIPIKIDIAHPTVSSSSSSHHLEHKYFNQQQPAGASSMLIVPKSLKKKRSFLDILKHDSTKKGSHYDPTKAKSTIDFRGSVAFEHVEQLVEKEPASDAMETKKKSEADASAGDSWFFYMIC